MKSLKRIVYSVLFIACIFVLFPAAAVAASNPMIALTNVVDYGSGERFKGVVYASESIDPTAYGVGAYIQLSDGGDCYYKPFDGFGLVPLTSHQTTDGRTVGTFSLNAYSKDYAENDQKAKYVHLMILPAGTSPTSTNYAEMKTAALDMITVTRTENSSTVDKERTAPEMVPDPAGRDPGLTVSADRIMVNVGFHSDGSAIGSTLSEEHIRKHLEILMGWGNPAIRFYNCSSLLSAYQIAKEIGFTDVVATANLTNNDTENQAELDRAAELLNNGLARICCVGNECLYHNILSAEQLTTYINTLRAKVTNENAYITTADNVGNLLQNYDVVKACDFAWMHDYPYYGGEADSGAVFALTEDYKDLRDKSNNPAFKVYIGETGHPTAGETHGNAVAGETQAAAYFTQVHTWATENNVPVFVFAAFDESAKSGSTAEKHFGFAATSDGETLPLLKPVYGKLDTFQSIAAGLYGNSLSLRGNIGINFYLTLPASLTADVDSYVTLNGEKFLIKDAEHGGIDADPSGNYYKFTWTVPAKKMNDTVTLRVYNGKDNPWLLLDRNGTDYSQGYPYSVAAYLALVREQYQTGALLELANAMSDYGSYAQTFFQYDADSAATPSDAIAAVSADSLQAYEPTITKENNVGITYAGSNLTLEAETTLRHFFQVEDGHTVDEYTFTVDGTSVSPISRSEGYCVEIPDIVAKNLGKSYAVTVSLTGGGNAVQIANYSALSYARMALNGLSSDPKLWNLVKALYLYNQKAEAYFTS